MFNPNPGIDWSHHVTTPRIDLARRQDVEVTRRQGTGNDGVDVEGGQRCLEPRREQRPSCRVPFQEFLFFIELKGLQHDVGRPSHAESPAQDRGAPDDDGAW